MARDNPGYHSIQVGSITVTALNDGQFEGSTALVLGPSAQESETLLRQGFRAVPPRITVSCFLIETPERRAVVDFGGGGAFGHVLGHAADRLAALLVPPESIDCVLLTHGHVDHLGGLSTAAGGAVFERAELVLHGAEADYWGSDENRDRLPEDKRGGFATARRALGAYAERTRRIADGQAVLPGIAAVHLAGHTPGHTGYRIDSEGGSLLIWADIVHLPGIQFARPDAGVVYDVDVAQARATRDRVMDMAAADRIMVAGMHLDFPIFGHVARLVSNVREAGYAFEPMVWAPTGTGPFAP